jgi:hypothetical protein
MCMDCYNMCRIHYFVGKTGRLVCGHCKKKYYTMMPSNKSVLLRPRNIEDAQKVVRKTYNCSKKVNGEKVFTHCILTLPTCYRNKLVKVIIVGERNDIE